MIAHSLNDFFNKFLQDEIFARFTSAAKQAIAVAKDSALKINAHDDVNHQHNLAIDTQYLLLGLMSDPMDLVAQVLRSGVLLCPKLNVKLNSYSSSLKECI